MKCVGTPISPSFYEQILGDAVVEDALALDLVVLLVVEGGGVILEVLHERARLRAFIENLGLAFVYAATPVHVTFLSILEPVGADNTTDRAERKCPVPRLSPIALLRN